MRLTVTPAPASALGLARRTIDALANDVTPAAWTDLDATLIGTGRTPVPSKTGAVAARLPVLG